jgi:hypothetical protein
MDRVILDIHEYLQEVYYWWILNKKSILMSLQKSTDESL